MVKDNKIKGYIAKREGSTTNSISWGVTEKLQGEVYDAEVQIPKGLGAKHPFNFEDTEKLYLRTGFVQGACNKVRDRIVGEFVLRSKSDKAQKVISDFVKKSLLSIHLREWILDAVVKGNGYLEIDVDNEQVMVHNANNMYVKRRRNGELISYNQYTGKMEQFTLNHSKFKSFSPKQIIHLKINKVAGHAYGFGFLWGNERVIENTVLNEQELHKLISRKAGAPIHVKVGIPGESVNPTAIDNFDNDLKFMNNRTEWTTDANVEMKVIEFGHIDAPLISVLNHDIEMFGFGMEIPNVLMGKSNVPEGLAKAQSEDLQRKIAAIQEEIEMLISEKLFEPLLRKHGLEKEHVDFVWNLPGEEEINKRIEQINKLLNNVNLDENMRRLLQLELVKLLDFDDADKYLPKPEEGLEKKQPVRSEEPEEEEDSEKDPKKEPKSEESMQLQDKLDMSAKEYSNLQYNEKLQYSEILPYIVSFIKKDKFLGLAAGTKKPDKKTQQGYDADVAKGLLSKSDIKKLKTILIDGFVQKKTIRTISEEIKQGLDLKDRTENGKLLVKKEDRPTLIAETETVRVSNEGLIEALEGEIAENDGPPRMQFIIQADERTCSECVSLSNVTFELKESKGVIPVHPRCRCQWEVI